VRLGGECFAAIEPSKEGEAELFVVLTICVWKRPSLPLKGAVLGVGELFSSCGGYISWLGTSSNSEGYPFV
jgi:hypothetical protein